MPTQRQLIMLCHWVNSFCQWNKAFVQEKPLVLKSSVCLVELAVTTSTSADLAILQVSLFFSQVNILSKQRKNRCEFIYTHFSLRSLLLSNFRGATIFIIVSIHLCRLRALTRSGLGDREMCAKTQIIPTKLHLSTLGH